MKFVKQLIAIGFAFIPLIKIDAQNISVLEKRITVKNPSITIEELIKKISEETGVLFQYSNSFINTDQKISADFENTSLKDLLDSLFKDSEIKYTEYQNQILLSKDASFTIHGYVREKGSEESLIGVAVYVPQINNGTTTNNYGFYSITLPKQDSIQLIASFVGYKPTYKKVFGKKNTELNIVLEANTSLKEVEIVGEPVNKISQTNQMSQIEIPVQQIKQIPSLMGEKDVFKVIQLMPGVQKGNEGSSGFYIRGGGPDQNLVILDDAPVYNAYHTFGFLSIFNNDALKSVVLTKAGFPAKYGGRLSSVLEMNMKDGNKEKIHGEGGIGFISSRLTLEGPIIKNKCSFLISARRTYIDFLIEPIVSLIDPGTSAGYYFYDLNTKLNYDFGNKNKLYVSAYFGKDKLYSYGSKNSYIFDTKWGNATTTARWNHLFSEKLFSNASFIVSDYRLGIRDYTNYNNQINDVNYFSGIKDFTLKYDFDYRHSYQHNIHFGLSSTRHRFNTGTTSIKSTNLGNYELNPTPVIGYESAIYFDDDYKITPTIKLNGGLRFTAFIPGKSNYYYAEPRLSASYNLKEDIAFKASYAIMNQYLHLVSNTGVNLPTDIWIPATSKIAPEHSQQYAVGFAKDFLDKKLAISVEGYYKQMKRVIAYKEDATFIDVTVSELNTYEPSEWENNVVSGNGKSYGTEFLLQKKEGKFSGWIGYTLSWTILQFDALNLGKPFYASYDRRHDISTVLIYRLRDETEEKGEVYVSANWVYGTGKAITIPVSEYSPILYDPANQQTYASITPYVSQYSSKNGFRMAAYHRLDLSIRFHKKRKYFESIREFSIYNAYNRRNPYFYFVGYENQPGIYTTYTFVPNEKKVLKNYSFFPFLPSFSWTFKF